MTNIFVFGSNTAGRHGKGAAKYAMMYYGAQYGVGEGITGNAYALPTKTGNLQTRSLREIEDSIAILNSVTFDMYDNTFIITPIGCGLAGYSRIQILDVIRKFEWPQNVVLSMSWLDND